MIKLLLYSAEAFCFNNIFTITALVVWNMLFLKNIYTNQLKPSMKRVFILVLASVISIGYSQTQTIEPGIYKSDVKGQKLMLRIGEGNQFEMAILYGKYTVE